MSELSPPSRNIWYSLGVQALKWVNQSMKEKQMIAAAKLKAQHKKDAQQAASRGGGTGGRGISKQPEPIEAIFTVNPQVRAIVTSCEFMLLGVRSWPRVMLTVLSDILMHNAYKICLQDTLTSNI